MPTVKSQYETVHSQQFSPCGNFLAAATKLGTINLFNLGKLSENSEENVTDSKRPYARLLPDSGSSVCSLQGLGQDLVVGGTNAIYGYNWNALKEITGDNKRKPNWAVEFQPNRHIPDVASVDCMAIYDSTKVVVGCRDNTLRIIDPEHSQVVASLSGHSNVVHAVSVCGDQLASASEDGTVRLWDLRTRKESHKLDPSSHDQLSRPKLGKWLGAVALNEDWVVCGGGPRLALWHLKSLTPSRVLLDNKSAIHVADFYEDTIVAAGEEPVVHRILFSGETAVTLPSSSPRVYSVAMSNRDNKLLTIAGASNNIDVCKQAMYRDYVLHCES